MIESLALTNLYCFDERTEISFVACKERNRKSDEKYNGIIQYPHVNLLKTIYLYGPNNSGKTCLLNAFGLLHTLITGVRNGNQELLPHPHFVGNISSTRAYSEIELVYVCGDKRYRYCIQWGMEAIHKEELKVIGVRHESCLFTRTYDNEKDISKVDFFAALKLSTADKEELQLNLPRNITIINLVGLRVINNPTLRSQWNFFRKGFKIAEPTRTNLYWQLRDCEALNQKLFLQALQSVGCGVVNFSTSSGSNLSAGQRVFFTQQIGNNQQLITELNEMSSGTLQTIYLIACIFEAIRENKTLILDGGIESIHPDVLNNLLQLFLALADNAQLFIASQNYSLLDMEYIRRDSIRFINRDENGRAHIQAISLGTLHKNQNLRKAITTTNNWNQLPNINMNALNNVITEYKNNVKELQ